MVSMVSRGGDGGDWWHTWWRALVAMANFWSSCWAHEWSWAWRVANTVTILRAESRAKHSSAAYHIILYHDIILYHIITYIISIISLFFFQLECTLIIADPSTAVFGKTKQDYGELRNVSLRDKYRKFTVSLYGGYSAMVDQDSQMSYSHMVDLPVFLSSDGLWRFNIFFWSFSALAMANLHPLRRILDNLRDDGDADADAAGSSKQKLICRIGRMSLLAKKLRAE